jgi:hypothetical protein
VGSNPNPQNGHLGHLAVTCPSRRLIGQVL